MVSKGLRAFTYQVTAKIEAAYYAKKTTEILINDTALIFFSLINSSPLCCFSMSVNIKIQEQNSIYLPFIQEDVQIYLFLPATHPNLLYLR